MLHESGQAMYVKNFAILYNYYILGWKYVILWLLSKGTVELTA